MEPHARGLFADPSGLPARLPPVTEALFRLFERLPRQGPGSDACTREALRRLGALSAAPRVLDLGCGSGRSALVLAQALRTRVVAVDIHQPFLDALEAAARERALEHLIEARCADMAAPGVAAGSIDLLWSEARSTCSGSRAPPQGRRARGVLTFAPEPSGEGGSGQFLEGSGPSRAQAIPRAPVRPAAAD
jgi:SAM-dependent methyltransferase